MKSYPSVTIAMAVYKPDRDFFIKQLQSIDAQDYPNTKLLIWNDSPQDTNLTDIVSQYVTQIPYKILDNGKNNGVTQAFANLTEATTSKYIAYSDQDDIWLPDKISVMVQFMEKHTDCSCCHSDASLIDENDNIVRESIFPKKIALINSSSYQERTFIDKSWNIGCAMVMPTKVAKKSLPFPDMVFHDQWLEIFALTAGKFSYIPDVLIKHRVHSTNNSATLHGVNSKKDYYEKKLSKDANFLEYVINRLLLKEEYREEIKWVQARKAYACNCNVKTFCNLLSTIKVRPMVTVFELLLPFIPEAMFEGVLSLIRKEIRKFDIR